MGCICDERLRFLHDVLQGRQVVQNVAGFQGMIGVLIKTERRAVGAGCGGDGGIIAPGVGGAQKGKGILWGKRKRQGERRVENLAAGDAVALGEGGGDSGADALGKEQYIVVLRPIYGG